MAQTSFPFEPQKVHTFSGNTPELQDDEIMSGNKSASSPSYSMRSSIKVHVGHQTHFSEVIEVEIGNQLNGLFDNILASAEHSRLSMQHGIPNQPCIIYEDAHGQKEFVEDLGDLIEILDDKKEADPDDLHLYLEHNVLPRPNNCKPLDLNPNQSLLTTMHGANSWSLQVTPIASHHVSCCTPPIYNAPSYSRSTNHSNTFNTTVDAMDTIDTMDRIDTDLGLESEKAFRGSESLTMESKTQYTMNTGHAYWGSTTITDVPDDRTSRTLRSINLRPPSIRTEKIYGSEFQSPSSRKCSVSGNSVSSPSDSSSSSNSNSSDSNSSSNSSSSSTSSSSSSSDSSDSSSTPSVNGYASPGLVAFNMDSQLLHHYGYGINRVIDDTLHGCVYEASVTNEPERKVAIKKVEKTPTPIKSDIGEENILKEAVVTHYLSKLNKPPANNICGFIEFVETSENYYLICEYGGDTNLAEYTKTAHQYISEKRLKLKDWRTVVKYIAWQLAVSLYWMHHDMKCAHLDLTMENIMIQHGEFMVDEQSGAVTINTSKLTARICDFGFSEVFRFDPNDSNSDNFQCQKSGLTKGDLHKSPKAHRGEVFDARETDIYALGIILYTMFIGEAPYQYPEEEDDGYLALKEGTLQQYLREKQRGNLVRKQALKMIEQLLEMEEDDRLGIEEVLENEWFKNYYNRYKRRIHQKSKSQRDRHVRQQKEMEKLPFYIFDNHSDEIMEY